MKPKQFRLLPTTKFLPIKVESGTPGFPERAFLVSLLKHISKKTAPFLEVVSKVDVRYGEGQQNPFPDRRRSFSQHREKIGP